MATLADKLKKARTSKKLTMGETARRSVKACGNDGRGVITQGYISRLEAGKETNPSLAKVRTLCSIYGIKPEILF